MESKYLEIVVANVPKNNYLVMSKKDDLPMGEIVKNKRWNCWVFEPSMDTFFSDDCMDFISNYLKKLNTKGGPAFVGSG